MNAQKEAASTTPKKAYTNNHKIATTTTKVKPYYKQVSKQTIIPRTTTKKPNMSRPTLAIVTPTEQSIQNVPDVSTTQMASFDLNPIQQTEAVVIVVASTERLPNDDFKLTSIQPEIIPIQPVMTPVQPEITPIQPEFTPIQPEITPIQQEFTPQQPEIAPIQLEFTPIQPVMTPVQPEMTPIQPILTPINSFPGITPIQSIPAVPLIESLPEKTLFEPLPEPVPVADRSSSVEPAAEKAVFAPDVFEDTKIDDNNNNSPSVTLDTHLDGTAISLASFL